MTRAGPLAGGNADIEQTSPAGPILTPALFSRVEILRRGEPLT
jgi:hypothetical protein